MGAMGRGAPPEIADVATEPGSGPGAALAAARPGDDVDVEARRIRAAARAALFGDAEPVKVGRFTVLERVGAGAMGVVFAAWDPQLDRKVALKVMQPALGSDARGAERLLAEARAAAKLSHPAVVAVYDAGVHDGEVWIAMEFIAGANLRAWAATPRSWREVWAVARQVVDGLAAAHRAGLLHRDLKPDNLLVDARGATPRAWIADFGLAISREVAGAASGSGTPAYMAPEQLRGEPASAASDQFALGVTFLELLDGRDTPAWLRAVWRRATAVEPAARWPSIDALAAALARDPSQRRRRVALAAVLVLAGGAAGALAFSARGDAATEPCAGAADALTPSWPARRAAVVSALTAIDRPWAATSEASAVAALDRFAETWRGRRVEVCRATRVRHQQSDELMDLRAACLDRARVRATALIEALAVADAGAAERAVAAVGALPGLDACDDELALRRVVPVPDGPGVEAHVVTLTAALADARAAIALGRRAPGLPALAVAASALGWSPLIAEAAHVGGQAAELQGDHARAARRYERALYVALAARADRAAADAALRLLWVEAFWRRQPERADRWDALATSLVAAAGDAGLAAVQLDHRGVRAALAGQLATAEALHRRAADGLRAALGPAHPSSLQPRINLGVALVSAERFDEAARELDAVRADASRLLGERHPLLGPILTNRAVVAWRQHEYDRARADFTQSLAIKEASLGPEHLGLATTLTSLAAVMGDQGDARGSLPHLRRAIAIYERVGRDDPRLIDPLVNLVLAELELREPAALPDARRLRALAIATAGTADDPSTLFPHALVGLAELAAGDARAAVATLAPLPTHPGFADAWPGEQAELLVGLARAHHALRGATPTVRALVAQATAVVAADDLAPQRQAALTRELAALR